MSAAFTLLGTITIYSEDVRLPARDYEVWCTGDPEASWAYQREKYYPGYDGPPPTLMELVKEREFRRLDNQAGRLTRTPGKPQDPIEEMLSRDDQPQQEIVQ
jgi:hypothetical protein